MKLSRSMFFAIPLALGAIAVLTFVRTDKAAPDTQPAADVPDPTTLIGKPASDFTLKGPDGATHSLSEFKGHVVVLDFWATWCVACRVEQKHLTQLYDQRKANGLVVFAVDTNDNSDLVPKFISDNNLKLPVLLDPAPGKELLGVAGKAYLVDQMPETVIIGKNGIIANVFAEFAESKTPPLIGKAIDAAMAKDAEGK